MCSMCSEMAARKPKLHTAGVGINIKLVSPSNTLPGTKEGNVMLRELQLQHVRRTARIDI